MRKLMIVLAIVLGLVAGAVAQTVLVDYTLYFDWGLDPHPCGGIGLKGPADAEMVNGALVLFYTCSDDRVIKREFGVQVQSEGGER